MRAGDAPADRLLTATVVAVDALGYALVVAVLVTVAAVILGVASGGGLVRAKALLFLAGLALMAYATARLWPSSPGDLEGETAVGLRQGSAADAVPPTGDRTRFQAFVRALPPLRWLPSPPPGRGAVPAVKLFLGSLFVLLTSYLMEAALGIA